jgi:ferredoxin
VKAYRIDPEACVHCGACASLAPELFAVDRGHSNVVRQPETDQEQRRAEAAVLNCPTAAIRGTRND